METRKILKACIEARASLARLDAKASQLPNPTLLLYSLPIGEAQASSAIENIVTTDDALFRHAQLEEATADPETKEAMRYRDALFEGYRSLAERPISVRSALEICRRIKGADMDVRKVPGTSLRSSRTGEIIYTPPVGEALIREKLANWEAFLHARSDLDPLVRLAVQHYQFEAIHPFRDGNGRTGRIINSLYLVEQKLLTLPVLYLSKEILDHRDVYYDTLLGVTKHQLWEEWIEFMVAAIGLSAARTQLKIARFRSLMLDTELHILRGRPKLASVELLDALFRQPYCRIATLVDLGIAKRQTASNYLNELVSIGILSELKIGREKLFLHHKLHELLTTDGSRITAYKRDPREPDQLLFPEPTSRTS